MKAVFVATLSLVLMSCGAAPQRQSIEEHREADASSRQVAEGPFHSLTGWAEKVGFYIDDSASDDVVEAGIRAAETWNDAMGREVMQFAGVAMIPRQDSLYSSLDDTLTMVYVEKRWKLSTAKAQTTLATTVWENAAGSDRIVKADVILNAETYFFCDAMQHSSRDELDREVVDAETVLLHEFGHLLGLDHVGEDSDPESIMHAKTFIGPNTSFRSLSEGDVSNIRRVYD